jgi:hypothetical protein
LFSDTAPKFFSHGERHDHRITRTEQGDRFPA